MAEWTFFTNHAHALFCIARDPDIRVRDVAQNVGITERAAQGIVSDLVDAGYLDRIRDGRRNSYRVRDDRPMRHPVERGHNIGEILNVLLSPSGTDVPAPSESPSS
ncbi:MULTISPECIES: winged helix-turn-helix domain-containing protein [unclassified Rhodococcus (in: high G+C Gram-positive bacteria)]|uniref:winged helix-turn-helix domain-containing protein n=1 Tax=unclassified Rhodococcus (in: high G+C Gram-positive bacteria) TaxID=192944 RepID=UPI000A036B5F|nr:winged helix-turn-helix domain-containing protein [Rhodococcus sp. 1163]